MPGALLARGRVREAARATGARAVLLSLLLALGPASPILSSARSARADHVLAPAAYDLHAAERARARARRGGPGARRGRDGGPKAALPATPRPRAFGLPDLALLPVARVGGGFWFVSPGVAHTAPLDSVLGARLLVRRRWFVGVDGGFTYGDAQRPDEAWLGSVGVSVGMLDLLGGALFVRYVGGWATRRDLVAGAPGREDGGLRGLRLGATLMPLFGFADLEVAVDLLWPGGRPSVLLTLHFDVGLLLGTAIYRALWRP